MKRVTIALLLLFSITTFAQEGINYKALIKDNLGAVVASQSIDVRFTIIADTGATPVYSENHASVSTDANGIVILTIGGGGSVLTGVFSDIAWGSDTHSLKVEIDIEQDSSFVDMGTTQFMSVPYAMQATTATTALNVQASGTTPGDMQYWNGSSWEVVDATPNEGAALQMIGGVPTWIGGTPPPTVPDAPTIGTAVAGNGEASIPFTAPLYDGGSPITLYTATSSPDGITGTLSQAGSGSIIVSGLANGAAYTFSVTATNALGTSSPSSASNSVTVFTILEVTSPTGKIWMDRNLGATQVATSIMDAASYGDLYQRGRGADGHQLRTSSTTANLSSSDPPGHGDFILTTLSPYDWRSPQNDNLWQGVNGVNNPCPTGYRLPTEVELDAERLSWSSQNRDGAFASPLKLPVAGRRDHGNGSLLLVGSSGSYWSSTVNSTSSRSLIFGLSYAYMTNRRRAYGISVRCIKD